MSCSMPKCGFGQSKKKFGENPPPLPPNKPKLPWLTSSMSRSDFDAKQKAMKDKAQDEIKYQDFKSYYCGPWTMDSTCRSRYKNEPKDVPPKESLLNSKNTWYKTQPKLLGPLSSGKLNLYFVLPDNYRKKHFKKELDEFKKELEKIKSS